MKARNLMDKKWEFETSQGYLADAFIQVLEMFGVYPNDVYIPSFLDMSNIEFRTTRARRFQIEYVFLRYLNKDHFKINSSITELKGGDWYAIY